MWELFLPHPVEGNEVRLYKYYEYFIVEPNRSRLHVTKPRDANTAHLAKKHLTVYKTASQCYHILSQLNPVHIILFYLYNEF